MQDCYVLGHKLLNEERALSQMYRVSLPAKHEKNRPAESQFRAQPLGQEQCKYGAVVPG
jgi:hypothetical protein